jgi:hypothetical protein
MALIPDSSKLSGPIEKALEVLEGPVRRGACPSTRESPVVNRLHRSCPDVPVAGAGVVDLYVVPERTPEQLVYRLPGGLAEYVPQGDVHRRVPSGLDATARRPHVRDQGTSQAFDLQGVGPEEARRHTFMQIALHGFGAEEGLAKPNQAGIGI